MRRRRVLSYLAEGTPVLRLHAQIILQHYISTLGIPGGNKSSRLVVYT